MTIARMTWTEIFRKRVLFVTFLMTLAFLGVFSFSVHALVHSSDTPGQQTDILVNYLHGVISLALGLYVSNFTVAYLAIFSSAGTISTEIENGLLLAILPRPIRRWCVYFGKWIGYSAWSVLYGAIMFWSIVLIVSVFSSFPIETVSLWKSFGEFELIPVILVSLSILGSIYLPTLGNGVAITLLFGLGMIGGFIQRLFTTGTAQAAMDKVGLFTSLIIPTNAMYYRMVSEFIGGSGLPIGSFDISSRLGPFAGGPVPSNAFLVYTVLYICTIVGIGMWRFGRKDI